MALVGWFTGCGHWRSLRATLERNTGAVPAYIRNSAILLLLSPLDCHAYIDPNAGGWLFQMLFPLLVAIAGIWAVFCTRIRAWWDRVFRRRDQIK